jgi:hypothetical protein
VRRAVSLALAALLLGAGGPAAGREVWRSGDVALDFSGSLREIATWTRGTDAEAFDDAAAAAAGATCLLAETFAECPAFALRGDRDVWQSLTRLRLSLEAALPARLSATLVYDQELLAGGLDTFERALAGEELDTFLGLEDVIYDGSHVRWSQRVYRGFLRYDGEHVEATVGRQRIAWGVGRLWNPIDRFNAVPPLAIEGDQSPGVDALEGRWVFSGFTYLQAVYAPGTRSDDASYALRFAGVARDVDYSLVAGVFEKALALGFDLAANLGDGAFRLEVVYTDPDREVWEIGGPGPAELAPFWQAVISWDTNIPWGSGLYFLVEHLYNGNALGFGAGEAGNLLPLFGATSRPPPGLAPEQARALGGPFVEPIPAARFGGSRVITRSENLTGLELGYDLLPVLRLDALAIWDWQGQSAALFPTLSFTGWNDVELRLGAQVFFGGAASEFGDTDPLVFVQAEWFF